MLDQLEAIKQQDASLFSKMLEYFKKLFKRIETLYKGLKPNSEEAEIVDRMGADTVRKIQNYFIEGLADAGESYQAAGGTKNTTGDGGVRYDIRNANGASVVWIKDNILKGKKGQPEHQVVASYIASHIGEIYTIIESGQKVYVGKELPQEYTQSKYTQAILKNTPGIARAKNRASANLGEMIEIATNRRWEKAKHTHNKDAKYGIYKYDTKFGFPINNSKGEEIGANVYSAELVIRNASDGKNICMILSV